MTEADLPEPVFQNRRNEFVVILYNEHKEQVRIQSDVKDKMDDSDLLTFCNIPRTRKEIAEHLGISTIFYAMQYYVQPLLTSGDLIMTIPEKPKSRNQKFVSRKKK
jgi:ATP-dependent DNA helicase RecG